MTPENALAVHERARCLFTSAQVSTALDSMAHAITADLRGSNPVMLSVMNGAVITVAQLALRLDFPMQLDYLHATRYGNATAGAELTWLREPATELKGRTVLIVDDILDQGATLASIVEYCQQQGASAVYSAVLIAKLHDRKLNAINADYVGLQAEDYYLYGYGMDYKGYLRNIDGIYAVDASDAS